jgi:hypothetical protein
MQSVSEAAGIAEAAPSEVRREVPAARGSYDIGSQAVVGRHAELCLLLRRQFSDLVD